MEKLIDEIKQDTLQTAFITGIKHIDERVLTAIRDTDRHLYVRPQDYDQALLDRPIDIGFGQTISQPFIVALITHLIEPKATDKVLEIGSGSGYQAAILSRLCAEVIGIEVVHDLVDMARNNLAKDGVKNVKIVKGDGNLGCDEEAPFDKIVVSAAANKLPHRLLNQLKIDGIMVLPKNNFPYEQMLVQIKKLSNEEFKMIEILPVRFVPFVNS